ncbi:histidinol-phosphate transaminase [Paeniglutamicibacter cryotolerans]|uniref:Aromatic amino acid aminotransferase n=1 Tax=Paeniglutamicibacter cryotolerans TaxID=670079 RepID=A0A839QKG4_9MICC|nr:histidinol-phosphate transaminase [Paeniglutamicibacter cryotolerans]MBB2995055.1 histidinol-phosphate aminotransferase [Paeniglutamicibacter cryotolerans]
MTLPHRSSLDHIPPYKQGQGPAAGAAASHKLSSNENPYPPLASVTAAVAECLGGINEYPNGGAPELTARLAEQFSVSAENICLGAGSVEVAAQLIHATTDPGDEVMFAWRSFEAYPMLARVAGAVPLEVPLDAEGRHDLPAMAAAITDRTRLVFICNPNNPTGTIVTTAEVEAFMREVPSTVLVVIDEAYLHFNREPGSAQGIEFFRSYPNVAVLHTFSKAYGLAGLRVGYAIAPAEVAANLRKTAIPFAVTTLAQHAAVASLDAEDELQVRIDALIQARAELSARFTAAGIEFPPSYANFIWLPTGEDTGAVDAILRERGIWGRAFAGEGIRISIGNPEANEAILAAVTAAVPGVRVQLG